MVPLASYVSRGYGKPRLIFSRINGPIVSYRNSVLTYPNASIYWYQQYMILQFIWLILFPLVCYLVLIHITICISFICN